MSQFLPPAASMPVAMMAIWIAMTFLVPIAGVCPRFSFGNQRDADPKKVRHRTDEVLTGAVY